ncbi:hypothetical protein C0Q70_04520 [Pomacea canaliculata]|uniref:U1 small nuclear ribonucleoprotein of 70kDa N-terminal domain-containing protein n=1 Tax=Pomacea canaliculata TaxID=400727 RepID=A0A2T7PIP4_POMCA|nr:hypothetical protein C0Q70_04520 [Pomacea canaliculata]
MDPKDTPPPTRVETRDERKERKRKERQEQHAYKLEQDLALWDPASVPTATSDPYKTLFIARINYDTSESKLRREFEVYGPIKKLAAFGLLCTRCPATLSEVTWPREARHHHTGSCRPLTDQQAVNDQRMRLSPDDHDGTFTACLKGCGACDLSKCG